MQLPSRVTELRSVYKHEYGSIAAVVPPIPVASRCVAYWLQYPTDKQMVMGSSPTVTHSNCPFCFCTVYRYPSCATDIP